MYAMPAQGENLEALNENQSSDVLEGNNIMKLNGVDNNEDINQNENKDEKKNETKEELIILSDTKSETFDDTYNEKDESAANKPEEERLLLEKNGELQNGALSPEYNHEVSKKSPKDSLLTPVRRISEVIEDLERSGETTCGFGCLRGRFMQKLATKKTYVLLYGIVGCTMTACSCYLRGIITTLEKRFKMPSTRTGLIMTGAELSTLCLILILNYYGGRGHRPRWIASGIFSVVAFCIINMLPHILYGPGEDALALTVEYGGSQDANSTARLIDEHNRKSLCQVNGSSVVCDNINGDWAPPLILFLAQVVTGAGGSLYYSLGVAYMDDNVKKSKAPALVSFAYFLGMAGPAFGYSLASYCLTIYIAPSLTPSIDTRDPRWLGAWWLGWIVLAATLLPLAMTMCMFPRSLPRAAARRILAAERRKVGINLLDNNQPPLEDAPTSFADMMKTFKRLLKNKVLQLNNFAGIFYLIGYIPFWVFMAKYIEVIFKRTAAEANFITGAIGILCSAMGLLSSGLTITKLKPRARSLAAWNVFVGVSSVAGIVAYAFLGCPTNDRQGIILESGQLDPTAACNADCHCDYVKYSPVCSPDGRTFISPCHAGCRNYRAFSNNSKVYLDCSCMPSSHPESTSLNISQLSDSGVFTEGSCPVDCLTPFIWFLVIAGLNKFIGATGRTSNFLVSVRCVDEKDKSMSMAQGVMFMSVFAFLPSPILFGYIIDRTCLVWGKTCAGTGNCWLYNADSLRILMNLTSAGFLSIGTMFDFAVWYYAKDLKIFEEEVKMEVAPKRDKTQRS